VSESSGNGTLLRIARRRFRSFSEAASEVLEALSDALPGTLVLGRLDPDERVHRVMELRGAAFDGLERDSALPLAGDDLDPEFLRSVGAQAWLSAPLEMSDGSIAGVLCALDRREAEYEGVHEAQLQVGARLLAYEWESVELRSELRRLRLSVSAGPTTDPETGLSNREGFLELLDHEWRLVERGTVESVLIVCRVGDEDGGEPSSRVRLEVKQTAEVLAGSVRTTDRVGRIDDSTLAAILIGCPLDDAPAFVARFVGGLERVTEGGSSIDVSCGVQPLADAASSEEALGLAQAASAAPGLARQDLAPQPAVE
jgi:GGDEF domain-containing protein